MVTHGGSTGKSRAAVTQAKNRAAYFADKECAHCGSTDKLELDHVDPGNKI